MSKPKIQFPSINRALPPDACCRQCAYSLCHLPTCVCPECGLAFDPYDPGSYRSGLAKPERWRLWAAPPPLWHVIPAMLYTLLALNASSHPLGSGHLMTTMTLFCCGFFMVIGLPLDYLSRLAAVAACRTRGISPIHQPVGRWRWWVTPVCLLLIFAAFSSGWLLQARFGLSRSAFERDAQACLAGSCPAGGRFVGLYWVREIHITEPGMVGFTTGDSIIDPVGFEYRRGDSGSTFGYPGWYEVEW